MIPSLAFLPDNGQIQPGSNDRCNQIVVILEGLELLDAELAEQVLSTGWREGSKKSTELGLVMKKRRHMVGFPHI